MRIVTLAMCLAAAATAAQAQERPLARADLPRAVEARLTAIIEDPATRQIHGAATIADTVDTNVVAYTGPLVVSGKIGGELIVVDGNVEFQPGAVVTGEVTVVGGEAVGLENAAIGGTVTMYGEGFNFFRGGERVLSVNHRTRRVYRDDDHRDWGRSTLAVHTTMNYNRVEGLPIGVGPVIETSGRNPTRLEAQAIWRTAVGGPGDTEHWGYAFRLEQFMGGSRNFRIGGTVHSIIDPIEDWQLDRNEAALATFVLHSDYRDYFEREGWSAYARYAPRGSGFSAVLAYDDDDHASQRVHDPWTLFSNDDAWRLQPLVAEGHLRTLNGSVLYDGRDDGEFASRGFLVRADLTQGLSGTLAIPAASNPLSESPVAGRAVPFDTRFTSGLLDARVYRRVNQHGTLSLRGVVAGNLSDQPMPPQFQHALGGAGSLPGYSLFQADCGARTISVVRDTDVSHAFFPYYGCDRTAMFSAEYRGAFDLHFGGFDFWDDEDGERNSGWNFDSHPNWILFFDGGRGWAHTDAKARGARDTEALYDAGAGLLIGDFGIYGAVPLTGSNREMKFFVRLGARF
ncbi:MAG TPA: hypothetical protein VF021_07455 [Longimicrobiales bacterium]